MAVWTALLCALAASLAVALAPAAAAESVDPSTLPAYDGDLTFLPIPDSTGPEDFSWRVELGPGQVLRQTDEAEVEVGYESGSTAFEITTEPARDAAGTTVPTTLAISEGDVLTLIVHHRAGNPAAGGASFAYPVTAGRGWEGGGQTKIINGPPDEAELLAAQRAREAALIAPPAAAAAAPAPTCTVPALRGLTLRTVKSRLRAADCAVGKVLLAAGTTAGKGKVIKQFLPPGTRLGGGAPVAVKLRSS